MAEAIELKAWARQRSSKGGARATRREGRIPGILYGDKHEPQTIAVDYRAITQQLHTGHFQSTIFTLTADQATGEAYCLAHHVTVNGEKRRLMVASLRYSDSFVKRDGSWLFAERQLYVDWVDERGLS